MAILHCLDEKSETPRGVWILSFLHLISMTAALYTTPDLITLWVVLIGHS